MQVFSYNSKKWNFLKCHFIIILVKFLNSTWHMLLAIAHFSNFSSPCILPFVTREQCFILGVKIVVHICLAIGSICHLEKKNFVLQEFRNKPSIVQIKISVYHWITYKLNNLTTKVPISFGFWSVTWMHSFWSSCSKNYFKQHICLLNRQRLWHFNESIFLL